MHAPPGQRIQKRGQSSDQRFSFAGLHFRNLALVQHDSANQLHIKMPHRKLAPPSFAHQRKRRNQHVLERFLQLHLVIGIGWLHASKPRSHLGLQRSSPLRNLNIAKRLHFRLKRADRRHDWHNALNVALMLRPNEASNYLIYDPVEFHIVSVLDAVEVANAASHYSNVEPTLSAKSATKRTAGVPPALTTPEKPKGNNRDRTDTVAIRT